MVVAGWNGWLDAAGPTGRDHRTAAILGPGTTVYGLKLCIPPQLPFQDSFAVKTLNTNLVFDIHVYAKCY